ncbi:MAG: sulfurtransferase [Georgenia sp.]
MIESVLVDVSRVEQWLSPDLVEHPVVMLDVRWSLGITDGRADYRRGHLPGAVYVDLDTELAGPPRPQAGRHPLPTLADLQAAARRWGVTTESIVVAYDDAGAMAAARAWWLLRWAGHHRTYLLDGGLAAWHGAGLPIHTGEVQPLVGDVTLIGGHLPVLDADHAARLPRTGLLFDARAAERYRGEHEPIDPRGGHIPGAVSAPSAENLRPGGQFRSPAQLRERFAALGASGAAPIGVYCGSGITATHQIAALAIAGYRSALYPGSWSQWSTDADRPAAIGSEPG